MFMNCIQNSQNNIDRMQDIAEFAVALRIKAILLGDSSVGKSSIINMICGQPFEPCLDATIGIDFCSKIITCKDCLYKLQFWDTAGQERFRSIVSSYVRNAKIGIIVVDLTNRSSFESLTDWVQAFRSHSPADSHAIVIGNKTDLPGSVRRQQLLSKCQQYQLQCCFLSAKSGQGLDDLLQMLSEILTGLSQIDKLSVNLNDIQFYSEERKSVRLKYGNNQLIGKLRNCCLF